MRVERVLTFQGPPAQQGAALDRLRSRFPEVEFVTRTPAAVVAQVQSTDLIRLSREHDWHISEVSYLDHGSAMFDYDQLRENLGL